jgi:hypothetical protein
VSDPGATSSTGGRLSSSFAPAPGRAYKRYWHGCSGRPGAGQHPVLHPRSVSIVVLASRTGIGRAATQPTTQRVLAPPPTQRPSNPAARQAGKGVQARLGTSLTSPSDMADLPPAIRPGISSRPLSCPRIENIQPVVSQPTSPCLIVIPYPLPELPATCHLPQHHPSPATARSGQYSLHRPT